MKKKSLVVAACLLTMTLGGAFLTACGSGDAASETVTEEKAVEEEVKADTEEVEAGAEEAAQEEAAAPEEEEAAPEEASSDAEYTTLEEYFATDEGKLAYDTILSATKASAGDQEIKVEVSGNTYTCTFTVADVVMSELSDEEKQTIEDYMVESYETAAADCQEIVKSLEEVSGIDGVTYEMAFADSTGELIYSDGFTAE